jgi:D-beta-D-heptose 7-phosphate kinase/D-beta-D-heptose 1-phosphate adenosyltransferase
MQGMGGVLDAMPGLRVLVLGDALLDEYVEADDLSICREGPAPSVHVSGRRRIPGGAANLAANLAGLGAQVRLLSVIGDADDGQHLRQALLACHVPVGDLVIDVGHATPVKRRVVLGDQLLLRMEDGSATRLAIDTDRRLVEGLRGAYADADAVIVSDYDRGVVTDAVITARDGSSVCSMDELRLESMGGDVLVPADQLRRPSTCGGTAARSASFPTSRTARPPR